MKPMKPRCPVCHMGVDPTTNNNITAHFDKARHRCPASGYPMRITQEDM